MADLFSFGSRVTHSVFRLPTRFAAKTYFDLFVEGRHNVPDAGPVVLAANHFSHLDPPIIAFTLDRYTRFLAVDELYGRSKAFDMMLSFLKAIPLDRDGYPIAALRTAIDHLNDGNIVGLFPEGRRVETWGDNEPKEGAAWLAWMTGAPLVPITIHGTAHSLAPGEVGFHRTAVHIWIDEPIVWSDYVDHVDPLQAMMHTWYQGVDAHLAPWSDR